MIDTIRQNDKISEVNELVECYSCCELTTIDNVIKNNKGDAVCSDCFAEHYENEILFFNTEITIELFEFDITKTYQINRLMQSYDCKNFFKLLKKIMEFLQYEPTPQQNEFINTLWQIQYCGKKL
jgi:hypothetical protein